MSKEERALKRSKEIYERIKDEIGLNGSINDQIGQLVKECIEIQKEINLKNKEITEIGFDKALELITIDKPTWNEFVNITAKKYYGRLKDKAVDKYEDMCHTKRHIVNLKQSFYDTYLSDNTLKVLDESDKQSYSFDNEENKEFENLMEENAKIKDYIISTLQVRYKHMYYCAYYLTEGEMKFPEFKDLVNYQAYIESDDPKMPDKAWKLFEKFNNMVRLFTKYINEDFSSHISDLRKEFGLSYSLSSEQPKSHPWQIEKNNDEDNEQ